MFAGRNIIILLLGFLFQFTAFTQSIINIEEKRIITDTVGWAGSVGLQFAFNKDVKTNYSFSGKAHVQYKTKRNLYLLLGNSRLLEAGDSKFVNAGVVHGRFNRKYGKVVRWEMFAQWQYNRVLQVDNRILIGMGPRLKLLSNKKINLYQGTLYMYEYEEVLTPRETHRNHRLSTYLSGAWRPSKQVTLSGTYYFQPLLKDFTDNRSSGQLKLELGITDKLNFTTTFNFLHDTEPPADVPKEAYRLTNGLKYKFN